MKKVFLLVLIPFLFQNCTEELHEIDAVVTAADENIAGIDIGLSAADVPQNSFMGFYYYLRGQEPVVENKIEDNISFGVGDYSSDGVDYSAYWEGYFDFDDGDYVFSITSDQALKVIIDDEIILDSSNENKLEQYKITHSLEGIRRLKVFYNMNSEQKLNEIVKYYAGLGDQEENDEAYNTSASDIVKDADVIKKATLKNVNVSFGWQLLDS